MYKIQTQDTKNYKVNSTLEFISSPNMRHKYKKQLEKKLSNQTESTNFALVEYKNDKSAKLKHLEAQNVRLHFLTEKPYRDYLSRNMEPSEMNSSMELARSTEDKSKSLVVYDEENASADTLLGNEAPGYPPLTINALMEYRPLLKAPGAGDFEHGKPRFFKPT